MKQCSRIVCLIFFAAFLILLVSCGGMASDEVERKIKDLKSPDSATRSQAALALADAGDAAKRAVPALASMLNDRNPGVRSSAAFALRKIGTAEADRVLEANKGKN